MIKPSIWYSTDQKQPDETGWYVAFKGYSLGDNEVGVSYFYWNKKNQHWRASSMQTSNEINVIYWCKGADPAEWYQQATPYRRKTKREVSVTEQEAWAAVEHAIEQYEIIKALTQ